MGNRHEVWRSRRCLVPVQSGRPPGSRGLSFENRLTLVLEKGTGDWKRTMELYNVRNQIAHGALLSARIDMARVMEDFSRIQSSLTRE